MEPLSVFMDTYPAHNKVIKRRGEEKADKDLDDVLEVHNEGIYY